MACRGIVRPEPGYGTPVQNCSRPRYPLDDHPLCGTEKEGRKSSTAPLLGSLEAHFGQPQESRHCVGRPAFFEHGGFDLEQIRKARQENKIRRRPRGASTISQQTAKNVFLWPRSSWFRKGLEVYFTFLIEFFWSKDRILEVYLNSIEMGKGIYGAEAVARRHFNTSASDLTRSQAALIAATLPNPLRFSSRDPSPYILRRRQEILRQMELIDVPPQSE